MEEKQDIQNLSWGIERVNLHSPDHIFVSEKHERSVATVPNKKKKKLHLGHFAGMKNTFLTFFDEVFKNHGTFLVILLCNTNLPQ